MVKLHKYLLTHLCREILVCFVGLHPPVHLIVVEVLSVKNVGLAYLVVASVVQVLGLISNPDDPCTFHLLEKPSPVTSMDTAYPDLILNAASSIAL
jgi:hypothetical protein